MKAEVISVVNATPNVVLLSLRPEIPFTFKPGQFCTVTLEHEGKKVMKSYSIASHPSITEWIELCVKVVENGYVSNYLANLKPGSTLEIRGPFGHFVLQDNVENDLIFVATGTGISSLKPMIDEVFKRSTKHDVWLFFGVRKEQDIIYRKDLEQLTRKYENFHFIPVLSDTQSPDFEQGHVQEAFLKLIEPGNQDIYICGLYVMVDEMRKLCVDLGFQAPKLHFEKYI